MSQRDVDLAEPLDLSQPPITERAGVCAAHQAWPLRHPTINKSPPPPLSKVGYISRVKGQLIRRAREMKPKEPQRYLDKPKLSERT